jgi:hypothetical protein
MSSIVVIHYGQIGCEAKTKSGKRKGLPCTNKAYFLSYEKHLCGIHSRNDPFRKKLPTDPNKEEKRAALIEERMKKVKEVARKQREEGKRGKVICTKLRMMREAEYVEGYLRVYPNFKHQNKKDGYGCKALSPKDMGPIDHGQPGLPIAKNLENLHQFNKVFPCEQKDGVPTERFYKTQREAYCDPVPHRHKAEAKSAAGGNKNIPAFSIWRRKDGSEKKCTYFESRQFYCNFYERIAKELPDFKFLKKKLKRGYNLQIIGYDAYPVEKSLEECYLDTSRPFGHELVLYTLLVEDDENNYPWRKYKTEDF